MHVCICNICIIVMHGSDIIWLPLVVIIRTFSLLKMISSNYPTKKQIRWMYKIEQLREIKPLKVIQPHAGMFMTAEQTYRSVSPDVCGVQTSLLQRPMRAESWPRCVYVRQMHAGPYMCLCELEHISPFIPWLLWTRLTHRRTLSLLNFSFKNTQSWWL